MQSLLIDINTSAITYRRECLIALKQKQYASCYGSIKAMNGLLPADEEGKSYRLRFDTIEYDEKVHGDTMIECMHCEKQQPRDKIDVFDVRLDQMAALTVGYNNEKIWICKLCKKDNVLKDSRVYENVIQQPFYSQVLPEPPENHGGLLDQMNYHKLVTEWVWLCLDNLEESFTRYRKDYEPKGQAGMYGDDVDTSLDDMQK